MKNRTLLLLSLVLTAAALAVAAVFAVALVAKVRTELREEPPPSLPPPLGTQPREAPLPDERSSAEEQVEDLGFAHVLQLDAPYVVLDAYGAAYDAGGEAEVVRDYAAPGNYLAVRRPLASKEGLERFAQKGVTLYGPEGEACRATVDEPVLIALVRPSHETAEAWGLVATEGAPTPESEAEPPAEPLADKAWGSSEVVLAATLKPVSGECDGAVWARASLLPAPKIVKLAKASPAEVAQVEAALLAQPESQRLEREHAAFIEERAGKGARWTAAATAPTVQRLMREGKPGTFSVFERVGTQCDGASRVWAVLEVSDHSPAMQHLEVQDDAAIGAIAQGQLLAAFELAGDLHVVLTEDLALRHDVVYGGEGATAAELDVVSVPTDGPIWSGECGD